jgi:predicted  nucleic acid-binding Zn-ribbon protein
MLMYVFEFTCDDCGDAFEVEDSDVQCEADCPECGGAGYERFCVTSYDTDSPRPAPLSFTPITNPEDDSDEGDSNVDAD